VNTTRRIAAAIALLAASCSAIAAPVPDRTAETLQKLADAAGPPGFEEPVRALLVGMMKPLASSLTHLRRHGIDHRDAGFKRPEDHGRRPHG
jgi:hypothetical protein